ncbi:hypothetical protein NDU88_006372 [Pleurodeles waltl]|uniref:Uncharacterized protein n=1 Tax=Pleurodeles waltl TaxID=8319 RepID=A0AAV7TWY7_PLEWA|nr:hypothetical protein NDU88_006372 [Pleurodeles waltl]
MGTRRKEEATNTRGDRRQEPKGTEASRSSIPRRRRVLGSRRRVAARSRAEEEEPGIFQGRSAGKSLSASVLKRRTGTRRKEEATNTRGDRCQEPEETKKDRGQPKQYSQETRSFGIEAESCSSVAVRHDNPEEKN